MVWHSKPHPSSFSFAILWWKPSTKKRDGELEFESLRWRMIDINIRREDIVTPKVIYDMDHRSKIQISLGEESYAVIYRINNQLLLFEISSYGSEEQYMESFHISEVLQLINTIDSWT